MRTLVRTGYAEKGAFYALPHMGSTAKASICLSYADSVEDIQKALETIGEAVVKL